MTNLRGMQVVITGEFDGYPSRRVLAAALEVMGATVANTVTKATDVLIAGSRAGSRLDVANVLGIVVWDEDHLDTLFATR